MSAQTPDSRARERAVARGARGRRRSGSRQSGVALVEALIGMLVFIVGILGMMAAQTTGSRIVLDAQLRTQAAAAADELLGWIKTTAPADRQARFATGGPGFTEWLDTRVKAVSGGLPNADATVDFNVVGNDPRTVRIVVTWTAPRERRRLSGGQIGGTFVTRRHVTVSAVYE